MEKHGGYASAISIWEIAIKVKHGKLELPITLDELVRRIERGAVVDVLAVDTATWLRSVSLQWSHRDPADRVIVATALGRGVPLLTQDAAMHEFPGVSCIW
jgi:PIN domain nuclease of toxin-antitoxin system